MEDYADRKKMRYDTYVERANLVAAASAKYDIAKARKP